jgi:prevent-host-death family protein
MERVGIRDLRNRTSEVVRRARAGERIVVTVDGIPAAQIVPLDDTSRERTLEELIAAGLLIPPRTSAPPAPAKPVRIPDGRSSREILDELRSR